MKSHSHLWPGVPLALMAAILFGASTPGAKLLLGSVDPQMLAGLLYLGAGVGLAAVHLTRAAFGIPAPEAPLRRHDLPWLAAVVFFGGVAGPLLLMLGLARTGAASGSLLLNLEGLASMAIAWAVFKENVDRRLLLGAGAILSGASILSWNGGDLRLDAGAALIAAACLAWGVDNNLTRKLSSADPVVTTAIKGLAAGSVNVVLALARGAPLPPLATIGEAAVIGFLGIRRQPHILHSRPAARGDSAHRRLFLPCALHRSCGISRVPGRAGDAPAAVRGGPHGPRPVAASRGTPRSRA